MRAALLAIVLGACGGGQHGGHGTLALRPACDGTTYWNGTTCAKRGDAAAKLAVVVDQIAKQDVETVGASLEDVERTGGPLDHATNVTLWEQRGIAAAYLEDQRTAAAAFDMLLALDPSHILNYKLAPQATMLFWKVREDARKTGTPAIDINWSHGQRVGDPVPLDLEVVADPKKFLRRATLFVRTRGESTWHAADVALEGKERRVVLPPVTGTKSTSLELYLRAYDDKNNEVLAWADPKLPREIPLRYDPPPPWWKRGWVIATAVSVIGIGTGITVYALASSPPDKVGGTTEVR